MSLAKREGYTPEVQCSPQGAAISVYANEHSRICARARQHEFKHADLAHVTSLTGLHFSEITLAKSSDDVEVGAIS